MRIISVLFILLGTFVLDVSAQDTQGVPFNGIVTDITGAPLKGAKVYVVSPRVYARSDKKGRFGLTDVKADDTLHVHYKKTEYTVPVAGRKSVRIRLGDQLTPEVNEDQDLVNWGYGFVKRRESIDVSSGISGEELLRSGQTNLLAALQGRIPGLNIGPSYLGADPTVNIRGINSINLPSTPLYIVDGVEVQSLEFVNLYDVDHVEVLKDASIYGSRGANGAILVTLKRGPR